MVHSRRAAAPETLYFLAGYDPIDDFDGVFCAPRRGGVSRQLARRVESRIASLTASTPRAIRSARAAAKSYEARDPADRRVANATLTGGQQVSRRCSSRLVAAVWLSAC